ncbi:unnamed protein product, partial [Mesorhabditis spiculigera]
MSVNLRTIYIANSKAIMGMAVRMAKNWDSDLVVRADCSDLYLVTNFPHTIAIRGIEAQKLLFHNSTVRKLTLYAPLTDVLSIRCRALSIHFTNDELLFVLDRHSPVGGYDWFHGTEQFNLTPNVRQWIQASLSRWIKTFDGNTSNGPELRPRLGLTNTPQTCGWPKTPFLHQYPRHYVEKEKDTWFRIKRDDGQVLIVQCKFDHTCIWLSDRRLLQLGDVDGGDSALVELRDFVYCQE